MRYLAEKLHRTFFVAVLHLAIRGAHPAEWLKAALDAFRELCTFTSSHFVKSPLPHRCETGLANVESILLRSHTNGHFCVGINRERLAPAPEEVHGIDRRKPCRRF